MTSNLSELVSSVMAVKPLAARFRLFGFNEYGTPTWLAEMGEEKAAHGDSPESAVGRLLELLRNDKEDD